MSGTFQIRGGKRLQGEITPQGAKNEALQILCAVLLTDEEVRIKNIPDIHDVNRLIEILGDFGVKVTKNGHGDYTFKADKVNFDYIKSNEFKKDGAKLQFLEEGETWEFDDIGELRGKSEEEDWTPTFRDW